MSEQDIQRLTAEFTADREKLLRFIENMKATLAFDGMYWQCTFTVSWGTFREPATISKEGRSAAEAVASATVAWGILVG